MKHHWNVAQRRTDVGTEKRFHVCHQFCRLRRRNPTSQLWNEILTNLVGVANDFKGYWIEEMHSRYFDVFIVLAGGCSFGDWCGASWWHGHCDGVSHGNIPGGAAALTPRNRGQTIWSFTVRPCYYYCIKIVRWIQLQIWQSNFVFQSCKVLYLCGHLCMITSFY